MELNQRDFRYGPTAFGTLDAPSRESEVVGWSGTNNQDEKEDLNIKTTPVNITTEEIKDRVVFNEFTSQSAPNMNGTIITEIEYKSNWWKWVLALFCVLGLLYWFNRKNK
jgi:hypothetical protein